MGALKVMAGKTTCKGTSCVDNVVCSDSLFKYVDLFEVLEFFPLLSAVHNPIKLVLKVTL